MLADYIPDFKYELYDLTGIPDEQIKGAIMMRVMLLLFKYSRHPDLMEKLPGILALMQNLLKQETGLQYLEVVLRYLFSIVKDATSKDLRAVVEKALSAKEGEYVMTLAEKLHSEGKIEGKIEGEISNLEKLYHYGVLTQAQFDKFIQPLKEQLQRLQLSEARSS